MLSERHLEFAVGHEARQTLQGVIADPSAASRLADENKDCGIATKRWAASCRTQEGTRNRTARVPLEYASALISMGLS